MKVNVSESVGAGHPDKIADYISDILLERVLGEDINSQFACEVLVSRGLVVIAGEYSTLGKVFSEEDMRSEVERILEELRYDVGEFRIIFNINSQSQDIRSASVESENGISSGDQSIVFGYAIDETEYFLPLSHAISADLAKTAFCSSKRGEIKGAGFDSKCLVISEGKKIKEIYMSVQHEEGVDVEGFREEIYGKVVVPVMERFNGRIERENVFINSGGKFVIGGLNADTGITNRKLMVDSYGSTSRHGGGGYSGKDLTKVDRLAAYYARWICKNLVAAGVCKSVELRLVYCFGSPEPIDFCFMAAGLKHGVKEEDLVGAVKKLFPVRFSDIYRQFNKPNIRYGRLSRYGHFKEDDLDIPWEKLDKKDLIRGYFGINS